MSAGVAIAAFLAIPWPMDLLVLPVLAGWAVILPRLAGMRPVGFLLVVGLTAIAVGSLAIGVVALLAP